MERLKEVFREHAEAHANEMMQDMFVCLGQEGEKVARLRGALESRGVDTRALLADLDEEEDSAFGERKSIVCDINYRVVGGDGAELQSRGGRPALEPAARTAAPAEGPGGGCATGDTAADGRSPAAEQTLSQTKRRGRAAARSLSFNNQRGEVPAGDGGAGEAATVLGEIDVNAGGGARESPKKKNRRKGRKSSKKKAPPPPPPDGAEGKGKSAFQQTQKRRTLIVFTGADGAVSRRR